MNLWVVKTNGRCNHQLWGHRRIIGCHGDVVIWKVISRTQVHPIHDWRPPAAVSDTTRHHDDVILQHGSRRWQVCWTLRIAFCSIDNMCSSHTRMVVRACFNDDDARQWKRPKFDPLAHQNLYWSSPKLKCVITSRTASGMQNFIAIGLWVSASQIRDFAVPFDVTIDFLRFGGSSIMPHLTPLNGFFTQNTPNSLVPGKEVIFVGHFDYI